MEFISITCVCLALKFKVSVGCTLCTERCDILVRDSMLLEKVVQLLFNDLGVFHVEIVVAA